MSVLPWKRLFWERTNSGEKVGESWGVRKEEELYKWFARLPACCCGGESWADQDYCPQRQGKEQASSWMGWHSFPRDSRQPCLHLTVHVYKYSLSISCVCKADGDTGGRQVMKGQHTMVETSYFFYLSFISLIHLLHLEREICAQPSILRSIKSPKIILAGLQLDCCISTTRVPKCPWLTKKGSCYQSKFLSQGNENDYWLACLWVLP